MLPCTKRIAILQSGLHERRLGFVTDCNITIADYPIKLLMALFLHILECCHVHDKPLEEGGDRVRASKEQVVQAVLKVPQAILPIETKQITLNFYHTTIRIGGFNLDPRIAPLISSICCSMKLPSLFGSA